MNKLVCVISVAVLLAGCGKSTEQICKETDQVLRQSTGDGFVDVGWIGCLKQSPSEAQLSLNALRKMKGAEAPTAPKLMSHDDMNRFVMSQDPFAVVYKLGAPGFANFVPRDSAGEPIPVVKMIGGAPMKLSLIIDYSASPKALPEKRDPKVLEEIQGKLAILATGSYYFNYDRPLTYGLFGIEDANVSVSFDVKDGKVVDHYIGYPKHLWQSWFN